jgi:hypothetical protein
VDAVFKDFVPERQALGDLEVKVLEEGGDTGKETNTLDAGGFGLVEDGSDEEAAGSVAFGIRTDGDGAHLGEVFAVYVEGSAAKELVGVGFDDGEGADVGADLGVGPAEQGAVKAKALYELMD